MLCDCTGTCPHDGTLVYNPDCKKCYSHGEYFVQSHNGGFVDITKSAPPSKISNNGLQFIASYESFSEKPYDDGYGNWTIGYGHLLDGPNYASITQQEALNLLSKDISKWEKAVSNYSTEMSIVWDQNQYDAYVSLAMNAGYRFRDVMDLILDGYNPQEAFTTVIYASGQKSLGLYRRRMDEADIFSSGVYSRTYRNW